MLVSILKPAFVLFFVMLMSAAVAIIGDPKPDSTVNSRAERKLAFDDLPGSIYIDCGTADDDRYTDSGVRMNISSKYSSRLDGMTLRSFPNETRNCYTFTPEGAKNNQKYIFRAAFKYGNYDNLNKVPIFDLHIGVNKWVTVLLDNSSSYTYYEIVYISSTKYIDVCLVNTDTGVPFISALELKFLDDSMYKTDVGTFLLSSDRYDVGATNSTKDEYGRVWEPLSVADVPDWLTHTTDELTIENPEQDNDNKVSDVVWSSAAFTENYTVPLTYRHEVQLSRQFHFYLYFAEIIQNVYAREMTINLNYGPATTAVTLHQYLKQVTIGPLKIDAPADSVIEFSISSTIKELPPILNAYELFIVKEMPYQQTDPTDVAAMMNIKNVFRVTKNWQGDPCIPSNFSWKGISCTTDNPPRIISLNLSSSSLSGELPHSLSNLTAIQSLDLSHNELSGSLPEFLAQLEDLTVLNLTGNNLTGSVPSDLKKKFKDTPNLLRLDGNQLCMSDACSKNKNHYALPLVAAIVIIIILVMILIVVIFLRFKRQKRGSLKSKDRLFSYSDIVTITRNFMTVIGEGGFGKVYHGILKDGKEVAVKMLSKSSKQGSKEFRAEAQLLMIVHHRNLVSLVGYCDEREHMGLVYEYMANGNLQQQLSGTKDNLLNWRERLQVAVSSAQGLEYLHNGCKPPIIHRDLKPANILLDDKMQAKISDFGLSRAFSSETMSFMETNPAGTLGYLDPEYQSSGNLNKKSDVYSFGIILLELITGQPAIIRDSHNSTHIVHWVKQILQRGDIGAIIDPRLHGQFKGNAAWKAVEVAMSCVEPTAIQRPDMNHVLVELKEVLELEMRVERALSVEGKKKMKSGDYSMGAESVDFGDSNMTPQAR